MLTNSYFNPQICERVVRRKNGELFRVRFAVAVIDGEVCGRIVGMERVGELKSSNFPACAEASSVARRQSLRRRSAGRQFSIFKKKEKYYLAAAKKEAATIRSRYQNKKIISPFSELQFFISQLTRAPSLE